MFFSNAIITYLLAAACHFDNVSASRDRPHPRPQHHRNPVHYTPVDPSTFSDYENRAFTQGAQVGDWVQHGLGGLMHMVNKEYGLRQTESFYWGPEGNPLANLTAYTADKNVRMLSLERFQNVLDKAECTSNSVEFTFVKEVQFQSVVKEWAWINDNDDNYLVLVTENARCNMPDGDQTIRQPWHVTKAVFDDNANTVTLTAQPKTWEDAFSHWHLKVSSRGLIPAGQHNSRSLEKRIGYDGPATLSLAADLSSLSIPLMSDDETESSASIACDPCYTTGALDFDIDVTYWFPASLTGSVVMTPDNVGAVFTAQLEAETEITSPRSKTYELFSVYPGGFRIDGVIAVGPAFKVDLFAEISATTAKIDLFSAGVSMSVPADARAVLSFDDASQNEWYDWTPVFQSQTPGPPFSSAVSIEASAGIMWRAEFDIEILSWGLSAGLALDAPQLDITLSGDVADGGVCDQPDADFGIEFGIDIGVELDAFAGFGAASDLPNLTPLLSTGYDLFSTCLVVASGGPTLLPSVPASNGSAPVLPSGSSAPATSYPSQTSAPAAPSSSVVAPSYPSTPPAPSTSSAPTSSAPVVVVSSSSSSSSQPAAVPSSAPAAYPASSAPAQSSALVVVSSAAPSSVPIASAGSSVVVVTVTSTVAASSAASSGW